MRRTRASATPGAAEAYDMTAPRSTWGQPEAAGGPARRLRDGAGVVPSPGGISPCGGARRNPDAGQRGAVEPVAQLDRSLLGLAGESTSPPLRTGAAGGRR